MHRFLGISVLILFLSLFLFQSFVTFPMTVHNTSTAPSIYSAHHSFRPISTISDSYAGKPAVIPTNTPTNVLSYSKRSTEVVATNSSNYRSGFISTWDTSPSGINNSPSIWLPLVSSGTYNFTVAWGDGTTERITSANSTLVIHYYASPGIYTINITGELIGWEFNQGGDALSLIQISHWGNLRLGNTGYYFAGARNLILTANDSLNLTGTTTLRGAFELCSNLGASGAMNSWNTSGITDMSDMFWGATDFNQPVSNWDVSHVETMQSMFWGDSNFNQSLATWNVSNVQTMALMFYNDHAFNQVLTKWDVSHVQDMSSMFSGATSFNQPLATWNVSEVQTMAYMFASDVSFDWTLTNWDVSSVNYMNAMFKNATSFNQPLTTWDVSHVLNMAYMFEEASTFNQALGSWNVSHVLNMNGMFENSISFNQPLTNWDVSNVNYMIDLFAGASSFNQSLTNWDVSQVRDMSSMFSGATSFNQPLASWDVSHVRSMSNMFYETNAFNQALGSWNVSSVLDMSDMFSFVNLSITNYDNLLNGWSKLPLQSNVVFNAGFSQYNSLGLAARAFLINHFQWMIFDGGPVAGLTTSSTSVFNPSSTFIQILSLFLALMSLFLAGLAVFLFVDYHKRRKVPATNNEHFSFRKYLHSRFTISHKKHKPVNTLSEQTLDMIDEIIKENEK